MLELQLEGSSFTCMTVLLIRKSITFFLKSYLRKNVGYSSSTSVDRLHLGKDVTVVRVFVFE